MGVRGPAPKPLKLRVLHCGNSDGDTTLGETINPRVQALRCPTWLSPEGKRTWKRLAPELQRLGVLTAIDLDTFAAFCTAAGEVEIASRTLAKEGRTYTAGELVKVHPACRLLSDALSKVAQLGAQLGLSPAARSRITIDPVVERDKFEEFLNEGSNAQKA